MPALTWPFDLLSLLTDRSLPELLDRASCLSTVLFINVSKGEMMTILILEDLPEEIEQHLQLFLSQKPGWTQARIMRNALSLFLLQNGVSDKAVSQAYLQSMFPGHQSNEGGAA